MFWIDMVVNQSGFVLVFLPLMIAFVVCTKEEKISQKIIFGQLANFLYDFPSHIFVLSFQVNNIYWRYYT